jgi:hypothetical protein
VTAETLRLAHFAKNVMTNPHLVHFSPLRIQQTFGETSKELAKIMTLWLQEFHQIRATHPSNNNVNNNAVRSSS